MSPFDIHTSSPAPAGHVLASFFPAGLPNDYLAFDIKTSGIDPAVDLVLAMASLWIKDGNIMHRSQDVLNWNHVLDPDQSAWLVRRLEQNPRRPFTPAQLQAGAPATNVLSFYAEEFQRLPPEIPVVGHALWSFKAPTLLNNWQRFLSFDGCEVMACDVGLLEKAQATGTYPHPGESLGVFQQRLADMRAARVQWSLPHCIARHHAQPPLPETDPYYRVMAIHNIYQRHRSTLALEQRQR